MNASTWTYYAIARKDWSLMSAEKYETVEDARGGISAYVQSINDGDYQGKIVILRYDEMSIWDENGFVLREVRTTLIN